MEKCIGCELCAGVCPAKCIYVRGADNDPDNPTSPGERFGFVYEINYLRCIHCDLCVEACPTEAITESKLFEFSFTNRQDAIYTKAELVVDDDGRPQHLPWEDWRDGEDADTSGWMRATSPNGDAEFVGGSAGAASSATASARRRMSRRCDRELGPTAAPTWPTGVGSASGATRERAAAAATAERAQRPCIMELLVFVIASAMVLGGAIGVVVYRQPGARRAQPRAHAVRRRRALRRPWRPTSSPPCR